MAGNRLNQSPFGALAFLFEGDMAERTSVPEPPHDLSLEHIEGNFPMLLQVAQRGCYMCFDIIGRQFGRL